MMLTCQGLFDRRKPGFIQWHGHSVSGGDQPESGHPLLTSYGGRFAEFDGAERLDKLKGETFNIITRAPLPASFFLQIQRPWMPHRLTAPRFTRVIAREEDI